MANHFGSSSTGGRPARRVLLTALSAGVLVAASPAPSRADDRDGVTVTALPGEPGAKGPGDTPVRTPSYVPRTDLYSPASGTYTYDVSWQGIPAAEAKVTVRRLDGRIRVTTAVKTYRGIDLLYRLRHVSESILDADTLRPERYVMEQTENSRNKFARISFDDDGTIRAERGVAGKEKKTVEWRRTNETLEPYSAAFLARSLDWKIGDTKEFDAFDGKNRFVISLTAVGTEVVAHEGRERKVLVIKPKVRNLTNPKQAQKLRDATIYVTDDASRDIVRLRSSVFIGSVTTNLVAFTPYAEPVRTAADFADAPLRR